MSLFYGSVYTLKTKLCRSLLDKHRHACCHQC